MGINYVKKKNNKNRVCTDFSTGLNECLRDHTYPLPTPEEIFSKLNGGKVFSKIMDMMLSGLEYAMAYLDNILIKRKNFKEHKSHV